MTTKNTKTRLKITVVVVLIFLVGCGHTQLESQNRKFLRGLLTAVSAKQKAWVNEAAKQIESVHMRGGMSDAEFQSLNAIITLANNDQWDAAQESAFSMLDSQRPTSGELKKNSRK